MNADELISGLKKTEKTTGTICNKLCVSGNPAHTTQDITNREKTHGIRVYFQPQHLTVFQCGLLYSAKVLNKLPRDYANYHKTEAGKTFFNNIKSINALKSDLKEIHGRIQLELTEEGYQELEKLRQKRNAKDFSSLLSSALKHLNYFTDKQEEGYTIILRKGDKEIEVTLKNGEPQ